MSHKEIIEKSKELLTSDKTSELIEGATNIRKILMDGMTTQLANNA
jgi:hypothetical protein